MKGKHCRTYPGGQFASEKLLGYCDCRSDARLGLFRCLALLLAALDRHFSPLLFT